MNHTPGPWKIAPSSNPRNGTAWRDLHAPSQFGDRYVGEALAKDAEFIVRACNAHEELLEALKNLLYEPMAERTVDAAKRAIRKAEGKEA